MLLTYSNVKVFDNSGVFFVSCISLLGFSRKKGATIGEYFVASIKKINTKKKKLKLQKGSICLVLVIKIARNIKRFGNYYIKSDLNGVILLNADKLPVATRFFGFLFQEIKYLKFFKVALLANILI